MLFAYVLLCMFMCKCARTCVMCSCATMSGSRHALCACVYVHFCLCIGVRSCRCTHADKYLCMHKCVSCMYACARAL